VRAGGVQRAVIDGRDLRYDVENREKLGRFPRRQSTYWSTRRRDTCGGKTRSALAMKLRVLRRCFAVVQAGAGLLLVGGR
jgi:hypothetical protein